MYKLLSNKGYEKYATQKTKSLSVSTPTVPNTKQEGPNKRLQEILSKPVATTKSLPTNKGNSLSRNFSISRFNSSMPAKFQSKINQVLAAYPRVNLPGRVPGVRGLSLGFKF